MRIIYIFSMIYKSPSRFLYVLLEKSGCKILTDRAYVKLQYRLRFHNRLDLENPKSYNEKLQWLKIYDRNPEYTVDVDKYAVREKIQEAISADFLVPLIGLYKSADCIDIDSLPDRFVIKCTHGTHCSIVCKDKSHFNWDNAKERLSKWLKHNYYYDAREWPYKSVKPRIIVEKYIEDSNGELIDYKFMCFDGKVKLILVHQDINNERGKHTLDLYTPDWQLTDIEWGIPRSGKTIPKPERLDEGIRIAEKLSEGKPHVRVDLYIVDNHVFFGELTYYTAAGFKPFKNYEDDLQLGSWINIEKVKR